MIKLSEHSNAVLFAIKVVPGSSRERIVGALGESLKVAVSCNSRSVLWERWHCARGPATSASLPT